MEKNILKYAVELNDYECSLILNHAHVNNNLQKTLTSMSKKAGMHNIKMSFEEVDDLAGWIASAANHEKSKRKAEELGDLYDNLESVKSNIIYTKKVNSNLIDK